MSKILLLFPLLIFVYYLGTLPNKNIMPLSNLDYENFPLRIQSSTLVSRDIQKLKFFYADALGLDILTNTDSLVELGKNKKVILSLVLDPQAQNATPSSVGLYHNAFVYHDAAFLAQRLDIITSKYPESWEGSANHSVSLAFYLHDPDGNGIELYWDTPKNTWQIDTSGQIKMDTTYIDPREFIKTYTAKVQNTNIYLGHIHLKVSNLKKVESFYKNILGFDIKSRMDSALFLSSGGYHHHIGANIWVSENSPPKAGNSTGLSSYTIHANPDVYTKIKSNLASQNYPSIEKEEIVEITDPWGIIIQIKRIN